MNHRTRLGPLAIFLAVVVMVITTMAVLTIATSNADRTMAKRFASVTQTRYQLEADELLEWKVSKLWKADDPVKDIWNGL